MMLNALDIWTPSTPIVLPFCVCKHSSTPNPVPIALTIYGLSSVVLFLSGASHTHLTGLTEPVLITRLFLYRNSWSQTEQSVFLQSKPFHPIRGLERYTWPKWRGDEQGLVKVHNYSLHFSARIQYNVKSFLDHTSLIGLGASQSLGFRVLSACSCFPVECSLTTGGSMDILYYIMVLCLVP